MELMHFTRRKSLCVTYLLIIFSINSALIAISVNSSTNQSVNTSNSFESRYSINPSFPEYLGPGLGKNEYLPYTDTDYYYETYTASPTDYHLISVYSCEESPQDASFTLEPYVPNFTGHISGFPAVWYLFRPLTDISVKPTVHSAQGYGQAVVEAEPGLDIVVGQTYESYWFFENYYEKFELCEINLAAGKTYTVLVTPAHGQDIEFWIYAIYMPPGSGTDAWESHGIGTKDFFTKKTFLTFTPEHTDAYAIIIMKNSALDYSMTLQVYEGIYLETWIIIGLVILGCIAIIGVGLLIRSRFHPRKLGSNEQARIE